MVRIEVISVCGVDGSIRPLRFRMEDEAYHMQTVVIHQVMDMKQLQFGGTEVIQYLCKARQEERERLLELRYAVRTHRWSLSRVVY